MNEGMKIAIGKELKKLRIDSNKSVEDLCNEGSINKDTIYKYESGKGNNFNTLEKLLNIYNVTYFIFFKNIYDTLQNKQETKE